MPVMVKCDFCIYADECFGEVPGWDGRCLGFAVDHKDLAAYSAWREECRVLAPSENVNEKAIVMIEYCLNADCPIDELFEDDILECPHLTCSGCAACPFFICVSSDSLRASRTEFCSYFGHLIKELSSDDLLDCPSAFSSCSSCPYFLEDGDPDVC